MFVSKKKKAEELHQLARKYKNEGRSDVAEKTYKDVLKLDPSRSDTWYNLGLIYKYQKRWQESLHANLESLKLENDEAACWNSGIAATALHDWRTARAAWTNYGINIGSGEGPITIDFGMVPIRLEIGEVVWCDRICPARAVIKSIPMPDSGYFHGDIVLHDGAANGYRMLNGRETPVFDALDLWQISPYHSFKVTVVINAVNACEALEKIFSQYPGGKVSIEDWTVSTQVLCDECSKGTHEHEHHQHSSDILGETHEIGIATNNPKILDEVFKTWKEGQVIHYKEIIRSNVDP